MLFVNITGNKPFCILTQFPCQQKRASFYQVDSKSTLRYEKRIAYTRFSIQIKKFLPPKRDSEQPSLNYSLKKKPIFNGFTELFTSHVASATGSRFPNPPHVTSITSEYLCSSRRTTVMQRFLKFFS